MPLPTDPETLRVPAFMRKRSLRGRLKRPLILTALDRKNAGVLPEGLLPKKKKSRRIGILEKALQTLSPVPPKTRIREQFKPKCAKREAKLPKTRKVFTPPLLDFLVSKRIGTITHYYDKIKVGVILLDKKLSIGDLITFETADENTYQQLIESMEINRQPVFTAKKGQEVGIKLLKMPKMGGNVM